MTRKGDGAIYQDARGLWTASIELPMHDGKRRRKVVRSKSRPVVVKKLRELQKAQTDNGGDLPTRDITLEQWMNEWFTTIAQVKIRPKTASTYRGLIDRQIVPLLGPIKLDKLRPADVRAMLGIITGERGLSHTTAAQVHRILSVALKYAMREGLVLRNVASLTDAPRRSAPQLKALTLEQGIQTLVAASGRVPYSYDPLGSLWAAVLLTGARQGELLGLEIDRVTNMIEFSWQLQRYSWQHACGKDKLNGAWNCGRIRGTDCPQRKVIFPADHEVRHLTGGLWLSRPKTFSGYRELPLTEPLASILRQHIASDTSPNPHGLVWRMPNGNPVDPRFESERWDALLKRAGVPDVRLHDGRHTTVDLLLEAGTPEDIVQQWIGHSTLAMTRSYKSRGDNRRTREAMELFSAQFIQPVGARSGTRAELSR